ncbi:MAG TPA: OmpA family protein [Burkholderiaceae bacterium]|nr:OmpA family protein [Burkholderiaceae bacterium]
MRTTPAFRLLSLAGFGALFAASSFAQEGGYPYGGLSIGQSRAEIDEPRITASLLSGGLTTTAMSRDERDTAYKIFGGWQFNRHFALEAGYFNLGKFGFTSTTTPAGTLTGQIKLRGVNLDLVGTLPLGERWSAQARVGAQSANARDTFSGTGAVSVLNPNPSKRETNYKFGAGLQYELSRSLLVRADVERYRINDAVGNHGGVNMVSLSLVVPFGRAPADAPRAMAAPTYAAPTPEPVEAPVAVAAAPVVAAPAVVVAPERRRVSFSADSLFAFDQSTVRPEGKTALDTFANELRGSQFSMISVEGHTDRLGSQSYNRKLSSQRAEAVKAYLVNAGGVDGAKITAVGKSESEPITKLHDCKGDKPNPKLIACLQPDRRVVVQVAATR